MRRPHQRLAIKAVALVLLAPVAPLVLGAGAPASAEGPDPADVLSWKISTSFDEVSDTHVLTDGATETAAGVVTFPRVSGTYDRNTGVASVTYKGSVAATYSEPPFIPLPIFPDTDIYTVKLADPIVTVAAGGAGRITALVSSIDHEGSTNTIAKRVEVTTFVAGTDPWTDATALGSLTKTPAWDGVLPAGSAGATALGIPAGQPVMGRAFSPEFLGQIVSVARPDFYATGASTDANKAPAPFTAVAAGTGNDLVPTVTASEVSTNARTGATYSVSGSGFTPGTSGVVVAIAESGQNRDTAQIRFAATEVVSPAEFTGDSFTAVISATPDNLDETKDYSIYTVSATPNDESQDTETPIDIDFEALQVSNEVDFSTSNSLSSTYGKGGTIKLQVTGVSEGVVSMTGLGSSQSSPIRSGVATFTVPKNLAVGSYRATFSFAGDDSADAHQETMSYRVDKARPTIKATFTSIKQLLVNVIGPKGVGAPTGKVIVQFTPTGKAKSGAVKRTGKLNAKGVVTVKVPTLKKGTYTFSVRYVGDKSFFGQKVSRKITVA